MRSPAASDILLNNRDFSAGDSCFVLAFFPRVLIFGFEIAGRGIWKGDYETREKMAVATSYQRQATEREGGEKWGRK